MARNLTYRYGPAAVARSCGLAWLWLLPGLLGLAGCDRSSPEESPAVSPVATAAAAAQQDDRAALLPSRRGASGGLEDDPASDGWSTEVFSQRVMDQLHQLVQLLEQADDVSEAQTAPLVAEAFQCGPLRPTTVRPTFSDRVLTVQQPPAGEDLSAEQEYQGAAGLAAALNGLRGGQQGQHDRHAKFKLTRIQAGDDGTWTTARLELSGESSQGKHQQNAVWQCRFDTTASATVPLLAEIRLRDYHDVASTAESGPLFRECTPAVLGDNEAYDQQLTYGVHHWTRRVETNLGADLAGSCGVAIGDVNGDGLDDVYVCQPGGLPNLLFYQQPDGTALAAPATTGVDFLDSSRAALWIDLDNDGDQDLAVATIEQLLLLENRGQELPEGELQFVVRGRYPAAAMAYSLAAADYDRDGRLDLYACLYHSPDGVAVPNPVPYHDANNSTPNLLLHNDGDWQFHDATVESGMDENNRRWSYAAAWEDFDGDGDLDLYVANDFGRNCLYRNQAGRFRDVAAELGVEDIASGMSVAWGDPNADGRPDLYVGNMFSAAGGRVTYQQQFQGDASEVTKSHLQRLARGNSLFLNTAEGNFRDASLTANVNMGRWSWGSLFADLNNDGWEDLVVTNGNFTGSDTRDL